MRRTLQTTQYALRWLLDTGIPLQARAEWQENSLSACDRGTAMTTLASEFAPPILPAHMLATVTPDWPSKSGRWAFTRSAILGRASDCRRWLQARPERVVIVVTHSAFLRVGVCGRRFANADFGIFTFANDGSDQLVECEATSARGGGMGRSPVGEVRVYSADFGMVEGLADGLGDVVDEESAEGVDALGAETAHVARA